MKKYLMCLMILFASCAHQLKSPADLVVGNEYPLLGNPLAAMCTVKAQNIGTVLPDPKDPIPLASGGMQAIVCGRIDCSKLPSMVGAAYGCVPFEDLQKPSKDK